jgi:hypothetical protein
MSQRIRACLRVVDAMDEIVGAALVNVKYLFYALSIFNRYGSEQSNVRRQQGDPTPWNCVICATF